MNAKSPSSPRRVILVDDNIRSVGGHFFELATLLLSGSQKLGYAPVLATHQSFAEESAVNPAWQLLPTFETRRLVRWSLGVDGESELARDLTACPVGGSGFQNIVAKFKDKFRQPKRHPEKMLGQWAADLAGLLERLAPKPSDQVIISTGDDFALLALAAAMQKVKCPPLNIHFLFHFAIFQSDQSNIKQCLRQFRQQINYSLKALQPHRIQFHATTNSLAQQIRRADLDQSINVIPYPTRSRRVSERELKQPLKAVLAGMPRAEKGRDQIQSFLSGIESHLRAKRFRLSMQMPERGWESMVPKSLHSSFRSASKASSDSTLEIKKDNLSTREYHQWLDGADVGLFLYQPQRYEARCSGVLLEMMIRGVPVIVPDNCWLASQVRDAGGHRSIGFIYQSPKEVPELLRQFHRQRTEITERARLYAKEIRQRHNALNTLKEMGIQQADETRKAA